MSDEMLVFKSYRTIIDMIAVDQELETINQLIENARIAHQQRIEDEQIAYERKIRSTMIKREKIMSEYNDGLENCAEEIREIVLGSGRTLEAYGIEAKYVNGRKSISYKGACDHAKVSKDVIRMYTKYSEPSVKIVVQE